jgi:hypothetical protein
LLEPWRGPSIGAAAAAAVLAMLSDIPVDVVSDIDWAVFALAAFIATISLVSGALVGCVCVERWEEGHGEELGLREGQGLP